MTTLLALVGVGAAKPRGAPAWPKLTQVPDVTNLGAVSCLEEAEVCVAAAQRPGGRLNEDGIAVSDHPREGASSWRFVSVLRNDQIEDISCVGKRENDSALCVAVGMLGGIAVSTNPSGGAAAWKDLGRFSSRLLGVSCASKSLCVATVLEGRVLSSTNPTEASSWKSVRLDTSDPKNELFRTYPPTSISCPTERLCLAVDPDQRIWRSGNPTGGETSWETFHVDAGQERVRNAISCLPTLCVAVDKTGHIIRTPDPKGPADSWYAQGTHVTTKSLDSVSCAPGPACATGGPNGEIFSTQNPRGPGRDWVRSDVGDETVHVYCASRTFCVATGSKGGVSVGTP
jgi:hypothetical protein